MNDFLPHGQQNNDLPKDVHILVLGTCDCVTLHAKRDFADVVKLRTLKPGDILD